MLGPSVSGAMIFALPSPLVRLGGYGSGFLQTVGAFCLDVRPLSVCQLMGFP